MPGETKPAAQASSPAKGLILKMLASFKTPMQIKEKNTDGINPSWPRSPPSLAPERGDEKRTRTRARTRSKADARRAEAAVPRAPPAATCRRGSARPHPRQRLLSSRSDCPLPSPATAHQLLGGAALAFTAAAAPPAAAAHRPPAPRHLPPFLPLRTP